MSGKTGARPHLTIFLLGFLDGTENPNSNQKTPPLLENLRVCARSAKKHDCKNVD
jgi:hypothetical protein